MFDLLKSHVILKFCQIKFVGPPPTHTESESVTDWPTSRPTDWNMGGARDAIASTNIEYIFHWAAIFLPASRATPLARRPGRMQIYGEPNWGTWQWENVLKSWIKFLVTLIITIEIYNDPHHHDNVIPIKVHIILDIVALACTGWWSVHGGRSGNRNERRALSVRCLFPEQCSVSIWIFQTNLKVFVMNIPIPDCTQAWISSPVSRCLWCTRRPHGQARKREPTKVQELVCLQSGLTLVIILPPAKVFLSLAGWQQRSSQDNSPGKPWRDTLSRRHRTCCAGPTDVWDFDKEIMNSIGLL